MDQDNMTETQLNRMYKTCCKFTPRVLELLESWDGGRGLLFVSHDDSGEKDALKLASYLSEAVMGAKS